ncbi:YeaH/YhbH family protein [Moritella sp. 36]|uniref:YeaH/YhbH family protein n=1 Tax=Moritella sp. 36 TaxID=2746233 RepID=UPI001BADE96B|nr:YeaH/YhbH family protein [Moritella sp. 36]QUM89003.1 YeaH/YhbH family protein [Moritella sp. 36]
MAHFIDRRLNGKNKSTVNRQRFMRRYNSQIKKAVSDAVNNRSIQDITSGESVSIPTRDISEPTFHQGKGGKRTVVHPGNDQFITGDKINRPPPRGGSGSGGGEASDSGEGNDDFNFKISKDEYLDLLFEDLELPNLQENQFNSIVEMKTRRAGYTSHGNPGNISIIKSLQNSLARRTALSAGKKRKVKSLQQQVDELTNQDEIEGQFVHELKKEIAELKERISKVPFIDTFDLRYNNFEQYAVPNSQAVMFCLMDVSGSMDQPTKDMAKRFYILLYLFLTRTYKTIEVVYIRHHTQAKEVDEHEFFYSQETGGTIVSSALKLMDKIVTDKYPANEWNIYAAQASDGDNWADDSPLCRKLLLDKIMPKVRYFSYIEITNRAHQTLWREYEKVAKEYSQFALQHIRQLEDIYPVFRELFKKQAA